MVKLHKYKQLGLLCLGSLAWNLAVLEPVQSSSSQAATPQTSPPEAKGVLPEIKQSSGKSEIALAKHLQAQGVKLYGAYWCPHCHEQHELFGAEAFQHLSYIECAPDGEASQTSL